MGMLLTPIKVLLFIPVFVLSGFRVNIFKMGKPKKGKSNLPSSMTYVAITPTQFCNEKEFIKQYDKVITSNREYLVGDIVEGTHWSQHLHGGWSSAYMDKLDGADASNHFKSSATRATVTGVISSHLLVPLKSCDSFHIVQEVDVTRDVFFAVTRVQQQAKLEEAAKDIDICENCGDDNVSIDYDGDCNNCGYHLVDVSSVDEYQEVA